jgi:hypothetical protein
MVYKRVDFSTVLQLFPMKKIIEFIYYSISEVEPSEEVISNILLTAP